MSRFPATRWLPLALLVSGPLAPLPAQVVPRQASATATLPESNEAMLLASQVENAIERADFRLAIRLIEQIMQLPAELVAAPGAQTLYPVRTQAVWLLRRLPPEGSQVFRELNDAEAAARFEEARRTGDVPALRELFRQFPIATAWPDIGRELAALLLDRGHYGEAVEVLRELSAGGAPDTPERRAQLAAALASIGARGAAEQLVGELLADPAAAPGTAQAARAAALREWLAAGAAATAGPGGQPFRPQLSAGDAWSQSLAPAASAPESEAAGGLPSSAEVFRAWPLHRPVLSDGTLVVRLSGAISAFDELTLAPQWSTPEIDVERSTDGSEGWQPVPRAIRINLGDRSSGVATEYGLLLSHALRHSLAAGGGRVFTIESLVLTDDPARGFQRRGFGFDDASVLFANQLVARDLRSGVLLWRAGAEPTDPLANCAFQAAPLVFADRLLVPVQRGAALQLCVLDPATGRLLREVPLIGPPTEFPVTGGRCFLIADETSLYVATGNGIICSLGRETLDWKWATIYPSTIGERLGVQWWPPQQRTPGDEVIVAPVLADDLLVLAPVDSRELFALDRFSGAERWRRALGDDRSIVGSADGGLILAGSRVYCVAAADGRTVRWQSVPLEISGTPVLHDGRVYVPTQAGMVAIDARNGKIVDDQAGPAVHPAPLASMSLANVVAAEEALFAVSTSGIVKYPDPRRLAARCESELAAAPHDPRPRLAQAWVALLTGRLSDALTTLEQLRPDDAALAQSRDRLLGEVLLALAVKSADETERLAWLGRAARMASSPDVAVRVAALTGKTLEDAGRWSDALAHYAGLLGEPPRGLRQDADERSLSQASWVFCQERIRAVAERVSAAERREQWTRLVATTIRSGRPGVIRRVRELVDDPLDARRLDAAMLLAEPPPELAILNLPEGEPAGLSPADARRLLLERCEVHASLGMTADARADLEAWRRRYGNDGGDSDERRRIDHLLLAIRKLESVEPPPFDADLRRQWKKASVELMLDPRELLAAARRPALVVRETDKYAALLNRTSDQFVLREWKYQLTAEENRHLVPLDPAEQVIQELGQQDGGARRLAWPLSVYANLAVMPVPQGVVCVGLGVERRGGQRLWEFPVPDWVRPPENFAERAVGAAPGFCFCPRGNRVVMLDWLDGSTRWQRDLPGRTVRRLHHAGGHVLIITEDQQVLALDPRTGRETRTLPPVSGATRDVQVVGDTLVLLGETALAGLGAAEFDRRWSEPCGGIDGFAAVQGREWFAYRDATSGKWRMRRAADGTAALPGDWAEPGEYTALFADDSTLFTAARRRPSEGSAGAAVVTAIDLDSGAQRWSEAFETAVPLNVTQLAGHPRYVPVLVATRLEERGGNEPAAPAIRLIDRVTGRTTEAAKTGQIVRKTSACEMALFVTPTRIVVQAYGNLLSYGRAAGGDGP